LTEGQKQALAQLQAVAAARPDALEIVEVREPDDTQPSMRVEISLDCQGIEQQPPGIRLRQRERLQIYIDPDFPWDDPTVYASFQAPEVKPIPTEVRPPHVSLRGTHVFVDRGGYSHHGIDRGDGTVVDFSGIDAGKASGAIRLVDIDDFVAGGVIRVRPYGRCDEPDVVIARAESMLGKSGYDLLANNCEHFATWCMTGQRESAQVQAAASVASGFIAHRIAPRLAKEAVSSLGKATPASAANTMSGLKTIGGTPAGGIGILAAFGAITGAGTLSVALADKPYLTDEERAARRVGRAAGVGGAVLATGTVVYAVGALGVPGYGAAGVSSGLAALGRNGSGMLAGLVVAVTAPVLAAWVLGFLGLLAMRWFFEKNSGPKIGF
jgi:hypothetical protein